LNFNRIEFDVSESYEVLNKERKN